MTKFLLEDVYGSSGQSNASKEVTNKNESAAVYIPNLYMIRRHNERDKINFEFYRYTKPDKLKSKNNLTNSRGLIEIDLIETNSSTSDTKQLQTSTDAKLFDQSPDDKENRITGASLAFQPLAIDSKKQAAMELIPGGSLYSENLGHVVVVTEHVFVDRLASPAKFGVALDGALTEKLWSLFEQGDVRLELSINWQLITQERGKPVRQMITQAIPVLTSMAAQRNCFHKYEVWADVHHDFTELQVQCFSFLMKNSYGLKKIEVFAGFSGEGDSDTPQLVVFGPQDPVTKKVISFPAVEDNQPEGFYIKTIHHFVDGSVKDSGWQSHGLRYFDASYNKS